MGLRDKYIIRQVDYKTAMRIVIDNHYLHRKSPCSFAFGLFERTATGKNLFSGEECIGVVVYGTPSSSTLRAGICGEEEKGNVIELTRLWIKDGTPKNTESFLIGNTLNLIDKEIVVSYADTEQGHLGIVYQATNWIYTGLNANGTQRMLDGKPITFQAYKDTQDVKRLKEIYGVRLTITKRSRKHRYVYFNCDKRRKKQLFKKLRYKIEPYPKRSDSLSMVG